LPADLRFVSIAHFLRMTAAYTAVGAALPLLGPITSRCQENLNMGSTNWSDDHYRERARLRAATGKTAFEYDAAVRAQPVSQRGVHQKMNPLGVTLRESRDSEMHPASRAVSVLFDV